MSENKSRDEMIEMIYLLSRNFAEDNNIEEQLILDFSREIIKITSNYALERSGQIMKETIFKKEIL